MIFRKKDKLNKLMKDDWIKALKSGNFKQGKKYLYNPKDKTYDCLGVLCKLNNPNINYDFKAFPLETPDFKGIPDFFKFKGRVKGILKKLTDMNDTGKSFEEIAEYIQINL